MIELPLPFTETKPTFAFNITLAKKHTTNTLKTMWKKEPEFFQKWPMVHTNQLLSALNLRNSGGFSFYFGKLQSLFATRECRGTTKFNFLGGPIVQVSKSQLPQKSKSNALWYSLYSTGVSAMQRVMQFRTYLQWSEWCSRSNNLQSRKNNLHAMPGCLDVYHQRNREQYYKIKRFIKGLGLTLPLILILNIWVVITVNIDFTRARKGTLKGG